MRVKVSTISPSDAEVSKWVFSQDRESFISRFRFGVGAREQGLRFTGFCAGVQFGTAGRS
jgi:hypothetical protein